MNQPEAMSALSQLPDRASAAAVFGAPATSGDRVVIPVAEVTIGIGFGWGGGRSIEVGTDGRPPSAGSSGGAGGGARSRAVAVIELSPDGVRVHPIVDQTSISLAGIAFAASALQLVSQIAKRLLR